MGNRLSKIYTRTGDKGTTGLGDGSRVEKTDLRIEVLGALDELSAAIGMVYSGQKISPATQELLKQIQQNLFDIGGEISVPDLVVITQDYVSRLENELDRLNENLPYLKEFILPGGCQAAALCHFARTVCRRVELKTVALAQKTSINPQSTIYLNRLSDLLFVIARVINQENNSPEIFWERSEKSKG